MYINKINEDFLEKSLIFLSLIIRFMFVFIGILSEEIFL